MATAVKPTYEELREAFKEYLDSTSNDGAVYVPESREEITEAEDAIERAYAVVDAATS